MSCLELRESNKEKVLPILFSALYQSSMSRAMRSLFFAKVGRVGVGGDDEEAEDGEDGGGGDQARRGGRGGGEETTGTG